MPHMTKMKPTSVVTELGALTRAQVWLTLAIGTVGFGGMFAVYTYISWTMTERAGLDIGPETAIRWITQNAANSLGIGDETGTEVPDVTGRTVDAARLLLIDAGFSRSPRRFTLAASRANR